MSTPSRPRRKPRRNSALEELVVAALDEMKAVNIRSLDVRGLTDFADAMIVASGNSDRHVRAIAQHVIDRARAAGRRSLGTEGARDGEWVLVDLQDVVVHVMLPRVREFYAIEQLWELPAAAASAKAPPRASPRSAPRRNAAGVATATAPTSAATKTVARGAPRRTRRTRTAAQ
jgi:ribosome-associated protein